MLTRALLGGSLLCLSFGCGDENQSLSEVRSEVTSASLDYQGPAAQFHSSFQPRSAPHGGFGGGSCTAVRTPVVFIPGNGDSARNWDFPSASGVASAYDTFRAQGWQACELFGIDYLSASEQANGGLNFHDPTKANLVADFIEDVLAYTGAGQVDLVGHSMGVTVGLEAVRQRGLGPQIRRFISIAAGLRGLDSCRYAGPANPLLPTCGSANWFNGNIFGFHPHAWWAPNPRMANGGFRDDPRRLTNTRFYSIRAGDNDQVHCTTSTYYSGCWRTAVFDSRTNVIAQLDVGAGATAAQLDFDFENDLSVYALGAGDTGSGVGHFRAKNNTGLVQTQMLGSACTGTNCCGSYGGLCR